MGLSTNLISGLSSGFDWRSMIDELMKIERRPLDLVEVRKREYESKLSEWQSFNTKLLSLKTAAATLKDPEDFNVFTSTMTSSSGTVAASDLLSVATSSSASAGSYSIKVTQLATGQKLSSKGFSTYDTALQLSGEFVINGRAVSVDANDDLVDIRDKINNLNTGMTSTEVTATILSVGSSDHRLILTSDTTGKAGIDLKDASAETSNILQGLGFTYSSSGTPKTIKNVMGTTIQRTDYFASRTSAVGTLLGLTSAQSSSSITVGNKSNISINLTEHSLDDIKDAIDAAGPNGVTTSIVETTVDGQTMYYLKIEGTTTFGDKNNILETIGILKSDLEVVSAEVLTADRANTDSGTAIASDTRWRDIDGADVSINDRINISGTDHNGNSVSSSIRIDDTGHRVQELLDEIEDTFGNVTASIVDGKIRVTDNTTGDSQLTVILTEDNEGGGALDFGNIITTTVNVGNRRNTEGGTAIDSNTGWEDIDGAGVSVDDTITISGTDHNGNAVSGTLEIDDTGHSVQELLAAIETAYSNTVTASITSEGKILIVDDSSGTSYLSLTLIENNEGGGSLDFGVIEVAHGGSDRELLAGNDATLSVDGLQVTSTDNTVEDVITGATLNLLKADADTTVTLNIDRDIDALMDMFSTFVDAYNEVASYIRQQQTYDTEAETTGGVLFGDGTLSSVKSDLTSILVNSVWGVSSEFSIPGLVGINLDNEGQLSIDTDTLRGYLETNFNDVKYLFSANGTTSVGTLDYISHTHDTQAGEYTVNITQAATRSTSTSNREVSGTLGYDETLTITEGDKTATISLTSDMTISDIINAVNTELDTVYTQILVGDQKLYADDQGEGGGNYITSGTTWDSIYDSGGTLLDLEDEDIITFSGTSRTGAEVQGSYRINDVATDTVQGLLSAIEVAYGSQVIASIDSSGHIVITDKSEGNSQLSLTFDYTQTQNQEDIFGSVLTTNAGGQEGRFAISITASNDGSNKLTLTHDSYGSDHSFIISEDTETGLWTGSQTIPVEVDNGEDVAGTINAEAATGSGQILTGDDDEANIDGLVIKYTGSTTGDVGNIKLTLGTAELFDRVLFNIADTYEGYVAFKQDSLRDTIDNLETQIEQMEARLSAKMENMINRFVAMELALSKIQSQSQWLSGQINSLYGGWGWM